MSKDLKSPVYADIDDLDGPTGTMGLTDAEIDAIMNYQILCDVYPRKQIDVIAQCECGKDKHGFANHSTWCPKHE